jgi:DNA-binding transcriptional ArsR family regulator
MSKSATRLAIVQAHAWDPSLGTYVATGQCVEAEVAALEQVKIKPARNANRFLKGPIPWDWIIRAYGLPGQALLLGLCLWRLKGATRRDTVPLSNTELAPFGIDRAAKSRGLAALEKAGLINVDRQRGRWSNITILP